MSKEKRIEQGIPALYRATYLDHALFNFVSGILKIRPQFGITQAIDQFIEFMRLDTDYFPNEHGKVVYYSMLEKYRKSFKSEQE
jgi:hypothetical protein